MCLGRVWGAELSVRWVKLSPFINCDYVRWPRDIGKCIQRSCVIFGLFLIPISWISANFCLRIIFHQWMMMEDLGRWWKTMEDDLWTLENVLKGLVSSLDRFWYPWVEFLWIFIWGSSSINGRWWKTMEDDGRWRKMMENVLSYHIQHFWYFVIWCRTIRWATVLTNMSGGHNGPPRPVDALQTPGMIGLKRQNLEDYSQKE